MNVAFGLTGVFLVGVIVTAICGILFVYPMWRTLSRTGLTPQWSLLALVPFFGLCFVLIFPAILALGKWPAVAGHPEKTSWRAFEPNKWIQISGQEARQNFYYGFDGWVLAWFCFLIIGLPLSAANLFIDGNRSAMRILYGLPELNFVVLGSIGIIWSVMTLAFMRMINPLGPQLIIISSWIYAAVYFSITAVFGKTEIGVSTFVVSFVAWPTLITWFWIKSKRVNVTYRHLIPAPTAST